MIDTTIIYINHCNHKQDLLAKQHHRYWASKLKNKQKTLKPRNEFKITGPTTSLCFFLMFINIYSIQFMNQVRNVFLQHANWLLSSLVQVTAILKFGTSSVNVWYIPCNILQKHNKFGTQKDWYAKHLICTNLL